MCVAVEKEVGGRELRQVVFVIDVAMGKKESALSVAHKGIVCQDRKAKEHLVHF
jgi:hypothetical protein